MFLTRQCQVVMEIFYSEKGRALVPLPLPTGVQRFNRAPSQFNWVNPGKTTVCST